MADFDDDMIGDAENYQADEEDYPDDDFAADYKAAPSVPAVDANRKRSLGDENNNNVSSDLAVKKTKAPTRLSDYFTNTAEPFNKNDLKATYKPEPQYPAYGSERTTANQGSSQHSNGDDDAVVEEKGPNCQCGMASASKTTLKEGPNKNRKFWVCTQPRDSQCKFFEWCDEAKPKASIAQYAQPSSQPQQQSQQQPQQTNPTGPNCRCNVPSVQRTTMKEGPNQGRNFWVCPSSTQCKFFEWQDAAPNSQAQQPSYSNNNSNNGNSNGYGSQGNSSYGSNSNSYGNINNNQGNNGYGNNNSSQGNNSYGNNSNSQSNNGGGGGGGGGGKGSCFKCGKEGHWSSNCPEAQSGGYNRGGGGSGGGYNNNNGNSNGASAYGGGQKSGSCYKCGESGHWSSNCPKGGGYKK